MIRVCHIVLSLDVGGMENGIINVANRLVDFDIETHVLCIRRLGAMAARLRPEVFCSTLDISKGFSFGAVFRIYRYLQRKKIEILYTHNRASLMYGGFMQFAMRGMQHIHGEHGNLTRTGWLARRFLRRTDRVTAVSPSQVEEIRRKYALPELPITVLLNGVDLARFCPAREGKSEEGRKAMWRLLGVESEWIPAGNPVIFVCAGRLEPRKNQSFVIRAFADFLRRTGSSRSCGGRKAVLVFLGDGPERARLEELCQVLGVSREVVFAGFCEAPERVFPFCDVLVLPSAWGEGLPNVALEAAACGLPVMASRIPGNDLIVQHGKTGYLLPLDDLSGWSQTMRILSEAPSRVLTMGRAARAWMERDFSLDGMAQRYLRLYRETCSHLRLERQ